MERRLRGEEHWQGVVCGAVLARWRIWMTGKVSRRNFFIGAGRGALGIKDRRRWEDAPCSARLGYEQHGLGGG